MENFYSIPDIFIDGNEVVYKDYRVNKQELEDNLFGIYCEWLCDIASGISFEKRKDFFKMLDEILSGHVEQVVITYKDRLSRVGFDLFRYLFEKYNCKIIVMSEIGNEKLDEKEIFEEIISLLHCYSMKIYSNRQKLNQLKEVLCNEQRKE